MTKMFQQLLCPLKLLCSFYWSYNFCDYVFRSLLRNIKRVIIAFCTSLVIKEHLLFLKVLGLEGANLKIFCLLVKIKSMPVGLPGLLNIV